MSWTVRTFAAQAAALFVVGCAATPHMANTTNFAVAKLHDGSGKQVGTASFYRMNDGVAIALAVSGMKPGLHGAHIHAIGTCTAPDFKSAGPHLDLAHHAHGFDNPAGYHNGDLPNLQVGPDGHGVLSARLSGSGADINAALEDADGSAIVIHADPDDLKTDPSGNSGARIACGAIQPLIILTGQH